MKTEASEGRPRRRKQSRVVTRLLHRRVQRDQRHVSCRVAGEGSSNLSRGRSTDDSTPELSLDSSASELLLPAQWGRLSVTYFQRSPQPLCCEEHCRISHSKNVRSTTHTLHHRQGQIVRRDTVVVERCLYNSAITLPVVYMCSHHGRNAFSPSIRVPVKSHNSFLDQRSRKVIV